MPDKLYNSKPGFSYAVGEMLKKHGKKKCYVPREVIFNGFSNSELILINSGAVSLYRKYGHLQLGDVKAPAILGLASIFHPFNILTKAKTNVITWSISKTQAVELISQYDLWKDTTEILAYQISRYDSRDQVITGKNAYDIIKKLLETLIVLPLEERAGIVAYRYIMDHSGLSRSRVCSILKELNTGGYIYITKGVLVTIKTLPERF
ncbi:TPA: helix-turn-helix domain-containing protein [Enterobacter ludwigii]